MSDKRALEPGVLSMAMIMMAKVLIQSGLSSKMTDEQADTLYENSITLARVIIAKDPSSTPKGALH